MPNFHDLSDGTSIINYAGHDFGPTEDQDIVYDPAPAPPQPPPPSVNFEITENPFIPPLTLEEAYRHHVETLPPTEEQREVVRRPVRINTEPYQCSPPPLPPPPARRPRRRREVSDPDAAIRKDPNAWSLREAVELCKLLEVVLPEAGFHIALTGPLLYLDGKRKECHLMFYQIRGAEPNHEILWKYLSVAGLVRSPSYPENGWLVKATYRGKAIDCLFPNAKKKKADGYKTIPVPEPFPVPIPPIGEGIASGIPAVERVTEAQRPHIPILYRRSPSGPVPYDPAELLAAAAPAPIPAVAQWEELF